MIIRRETDWNVLKIFQFGEDILWKIRWNILKKKKPILKIKQNSFVF